MKEKATGGGKPPGTNWKAPGTNWKPPGTEWKRLEQTAAGGGKPPGTNLNRQPLAAETGTDWDRQRRAAASRQALALIHNGRCRRTTPAKASG